MSIHNHAAVLAEAGHPAVALVAAAEAVDLYRELAIGNRDAHLPNLARSLRNAGYVAQLLGQVTERAIVQTAEGVELFTELAVSEPAAFTGLRDAAAKTLADLRDIATRSDEHDTTQDKIY